jgi:beta-glucosidase
MLQALLFLTLTLLPAPTSASEVGRLSSDARPPSGPFLWGVASSSFQVEGSPADSNWYRWTHEAGRIEDGTNADVATDFWNRYDEDFGWAQMLGANAYRVSIAWERIEPEQGRWDEEALTHYERMITAMRAHGLEPVITLFHGPLPGWLHGKGGSLARHFDKRFSEYASRVVSRLAAPPASARYWLTFNEPTTYAEGAYIEGTDPPGKSGRVDLFLRSIKAQTQAHIRAVRELRKLPYDLKFSVAQDWEVFQAEKSESGFERWIASVPAKIYNRSLLDPAFKAHTLDFVGINYYTRKILGLRPKPPFVVEVRGSGPHDELGTEVYPEGLAITARDVYDRYHLPILFTENGVVDSADALRPEYLRRHIEELTKVRTEGIPVMGYLHWSLTDNFEWSSGHGPRLGLIEIDYTSQRRKPRPSYFVYQQLIRDSRD